MRSLRIVAVLAMPLALLAACYSIPGVTSPIPGPSTAEKAKICADARARLAAPERYAGSHKAERDVLKTYNCPPE
jgi:aryl-alcohol dehydrogenase-like predicted oxidoreductase